MLLFYLLLILISAVSAETISEDTYNDDPPQFTSDLTVDAGAYLVYDNRDGEPINFNGGVTIHGGLFVVDSENTNFGMTINIEGDFTNTGVTVLNAANETSDPSFTILAGSFLNDGNLFMVGTGTTILSMNIWPLGSAVNNGIITFYNTNARINGGSSFGISNQPVTNTGTICLHHMNFLSDATLSGTGCYTVGIDSLFSFFFSRPGQLSDVPNYLSFFTIVERTAQQLPVTERYYHIWMGK